MLTRDNILGADDLPREEVAIPEWGGTAWVRAVMADELDAFEASCLNGSSKPSLKNLRAKFCAMVLCDSEGNRLFHDADAIALGKKSAAALDRIFAVGQRLNKRTKEDVEELLKNSESVPSDASSSA